MHVDDAAAFIVDFLQMPRRDDGYPSYGYDIWFPKVIVTYIREVEHSTEHLQNLYRGRRADELSPFFMTPPGVSAVAVSSGQVSRMHVDQVGPMERALMDIALQALAGAG
jgi:hypothetical protein